MVGVEGKINKPETIGEKGSVKSVCPWWLLLDSQSTVIVIMNKELLKDIRDAYGRFVCVHYNEETITIRTETTLPRIVTV